MNTIFKKISAVVLGMFVVTGMAAPLATTFAATFNNASNDYATLQVSNYSRNPGSNTNWSNSVSAAPGEIVSFLVYYHNTQNDVASATYARVMLPSGTFTSQTVTGDVRATNATPVTGSASVTLSSPQTLTFVPGSVSWYPNRASASQALLSGQNGSEIVSNQGLYIGDIAGDANGGWATQGYIVFRAQVGGSNNGSTGSTGSAATVTTNSAYSITQNSATLSGAVNPNNSSANAWFEYGTNQSFGSITGNQSVGSSNSSMSVSGYLSNLSPNTVYWYRAVAQNAYGTTYGQAMSFTTGNSSTNSNNSAPSTFTNTATSITMTSASLNAAVNANGSYTNGWFEYGLTNSLGYVTGYQGIGSGTYTANIATTISGLAPNTTYYYRAVGQNAYGTNYGNVLSFTTGNNGGSTNNAFGIAPYVTTKAASFAARNSALLNGATNPNGSIATAWFEYGTTNALGRTTTAQPMGLATYASNYSFALSGLESDTTYYYRAVAQNAYGTTYGNVLSFTTTPAPIARTTSTVNNGGPANITVVRTTTVNGDVAGKVSLTPSVDKTDPNAGDEVTYSVEYTNDSASGITGSVLTIALPAEVEYLDSNVRPSSINENRTVVYNLGTVKANSQGKIDIKVRIASGTKADSSLLFSATLNYNDAQARFQSTSAYLTVQVAKGASGLASVASVLGKLFTNWFVDLILGLLVGFGIYHFFVRQKEEEVLIK